MTADSFALDPHHHRQSRARVRYRRPDVQRQPVVAVLRPREGDATEDRHPGFLGAAQPPPARPNSRAWSFSIGPGLASTLGEALDLPRMDVADPLPAWLGRRTDPRVGDGLRLKACAYARSRSIRAAT